jgi:hypothetical protein
MLIPRPLAKLCIAITGLFAATYPLTARAVLVGTGDGTQDTTQGSMPDGWNYVGSVGSASGVYLGTAPGSNTGWVITADHIGTVVVNATPFSLPGYGTYTASTVVRLTNSDNSATDMQMFEITGTPLQPLPTNAQLPPLNIASATPAAATPIYMVGYGYSVRNTSPTYYNVTGPANNPTWTVVSDPSQANYGGFGYGTALQPKRWGTNVTMTDPNTGLTTVVLNAGFGNTTTLIADFYDNLQDYLNSGGTSEESTVAQFDSGGGVFTSDDTLVGLNAYHDTYYNEPPDTSIFGEGVYPIDLAAYSSEIQSILVPEPSIGLLAGMMMISLLGRRNRQLRPGN